jgi:hypothetical protein
MTATSYIGVAIDEDVPETYSFEQAASRRVIGAHSVQPEWADHSGEQGPMTFDRRRMPRKAMKGHAMAVFTQGLCAGSVVRVELTDGSHTGLGIKSPVPVEAGTSFSLIPEHAMMPRAVGVAVRCELLPDGQYHIGLKTRMGALAA